MFFFLTLFVFFCYILYIIIIIIICGSVPKIRCVHMVQDHKSCILIQIRYSHRCMQVAKYTYVCMYVCEYKIDF